MNILHKVRRIEADLTRVVERTAREWAKSGTREPLEIAQAIVETVAERLEPAARGRYVIIRHTADSEDSVWSISEPLVD